MSRFSLFRWFAIALTFLALTGCELQRPGGTGEDIKPLVPEAIAQTNAVVSIYPTTQQLDIGDTTTIEIWIRDVTNLAAVNFEIQFDPARLLVNDADSNPDNGTQIQPGDFMDATFVLTNQVDNAAGIIRYSIDLVSPTPPVSGQGILALVEFTGIVEGRSELSFINVQLAGSNAESIAASTTPAEIIINLAGVETQPQQPAPEATQPPPTSAPVDTPPETAPDQPLPPPSDQPAPPAAENIPLEDIPQAAVPPTAAPAQMVIAATPPPPTPAAIPQPVPIPPNATTGFCYRTIPGETIDVLSAKYGTSPQDITRANDLYPPGHVVGNQTLFIPTSPAISGPNVYPVQYGDDLATIAERCKLPVTMVAKYNNMLPDTPLYLPAGNSWKSPHGDTIYVNQDTILIKYLIIPIPPFPPPSQFPYTALPIVPVPPPCCN